MEAEIYKKVRKVLFFILLINAGVAILKIIIGAIIKSAGITADGFHSITDGASNVIGLIGIKLAARPVDEDHPYGHKKFETLTGLIIATMLFFIGGKICVDAINRFIDPVLPEITSESLVMLLAALAVNIFICTYEHRKGRKLKSQILISDSMHTRSDIYISIGVLAALLLIKLGLPPVIDPIVSLVVAGFIFHAGYEIYRDNSNILVDRAVVDTDRIRDIALSFKQVKDTHNIRSRGSENDLHIDMHIMTEPDMSVEESHTLIHDLEEQIRREIGKNVQVFAHIEPYDDKKDIEDK